MPQHEWATSSNLAAEHLDALCTLDLQSGLESIDRHEDDAEGASANRGCQRLDPDGQVLRAVQALHTSEHSGTRQV